MVLNGEQGWEYKLSEKGHGQDRTGKVTSGLSTLRGNSHYIATPKSPRIYLAPHHSTSLFPQTMVALPPTLFPFHPSLPYTLSPVGDTLHSAPAMGFKVNPKTPPFFKIKIINKEVGVLPSMCPFMWLYILTIYIVIIIASITEHSLCIRHYQPLIFIIFHSHNPLE